MFVSKMENATVACCELCCTNNFYRETKWDQNFQVVFQKYETLISIDICYDTTKNPALEYSLTQEYVVWFTPCV